MRQALKIVFIGWGAINSHVGNLLKARGVPLEVLGIAVKDSAPAGIPGGVPILGDPEQLLNLKPDVVVEAAGRQAIDQWAPAALQVSKFLIMASTSAFCDDGLLPRLAQIADAHGSRIILPSGAIGAIDALSSAAVLALDQVTHQITKPPAAWRGTPAENLFDPATLKERLVFFSGTAREAASGYPQNANATIVTALAGLGLDATKVELVADPSANINSHRIVADGAFGSLDVTFKNKPLIGNPKSSELTALSLVRLIEHHTRSVVI